MDTTLCTVITGVVLILQKENRILLFKRNMPNKIAYGKFALPGGTVEHDESIVQTACREAYEEIGIIIDPSEVQIVYLQRMREKIDPKTQQTQQILFLYYAHIRTWQGEPHNLEPEKHSDLAWFDINALPQTIFEYNVFALEDIKKGIPFAECGWHIQNQLIPQNKEQERLF